MGSSPIAVTSTSDIVLVSIKDFLDIQATIQRRFTLKLVLEMIKLFSQMDRIDKYSQHSSMISPVLLDG